jgi:hypothetical protein
MTEQRIGRILAGVGIGVSVFMGGGVAMAAPNPAGPSAGDTAAAQKAASQAETQLMVAKFFVNLDRHEAGRLTTKSPDGDAAMRAKAPRVSTSAHPVYSLNPDFVRGDRNAPVATFAYMVFGARSATGQDASVRLVKSPQGWQVMNIGSGAEEATYPAQAGTGMIFTEPQLDAWYRLSGDRVTGLSPTAKTSAGAQGMSLTAYQKLVHGRYADKLPGSTYARDGKLGGYQPAPAAEPAGEGGGGIGSPALAAMGTGGALVAAAGAIMIRRRRTNTLH